MSNKIQFKKKQIIFLGMIIFIIVIFGGIILIAPAKPLIAKKEIVLGYNIKDIWNVVTHNENYHP
jgi:hypothetical protein